MAQFSVHPASVSDDPEVRVSNGLAVPNVRSAMRIAPRSVAWITDDLLRETRRVWSKAYGRPVDDTEATEILMNVKRFAEVVQKATKQEHEK